MTPTLAYLLGLVTLPGMVLALGLARIGRALVDGSV